MSARWHVDVEDAIAAKWSAGRAVHGPVWRGAHPLAELHNELLDAVCYARQATRAGAGDPETEATLIALLERTRARLHALEAAGVELRTWTMPREEA